MDMANMAGMTGMASSATSTSSTMAKMVIATAKAMSTAAMSPTPAASTTMGGAAMASSIMNNPQAGMATSMATEKDMCALPGMSQMCESRTHIVIGTCIGLMILSTVAVLLRLASRRVSALSFWYDDAVIISSLIVSFACSALMLVDANNGIGRHFETVPESSVVLLFKTTVAYEILYCVCVTLIKISILLFYYRLFGVRKAFKYSCYIVLALVICWCIAIVFSNIFQCIPVEAAWIRPYPHSKCINNNASLLGTAITNVFLDVVILVLPMAPIWSLSLTLRQKITLTAIFLLGAFICTAAIVRVWAILNIDQTDVTWSYVRPLIWSAVEISIGITCACLPTLQPLIQLCLGRRSLSNNNNHPDRRYQNHIDTHYNINNHPNHQKPKNSNNPKIKNNRTHPPFPLSPAPSYAVTVSVGAATHGRPQMVGVRAPSYSRSLGTEYYPLQKTGAGAHMHNVKEILAESRWDSREDLSSERAGTSWSEEDEVPLKGGGRGGAGGREKGREKREAGVVVQTREDTESGGALSPV